MREPRTTGIVVDLTVPINKNDFDMSTGCFGKEWDVTTNECKICADRDVCGILFKDRVDKIASEQEEKLGSKFLDMADFDLNEEELKQLENFIESGVTKVTDFLQEISRVCNSSDAVAITEFAKRFIKGNENIYTKEGIVWKK